MLSIIVPCKKRLSHLAKTMHYFRQQIGVVYEVIIVDYNCPDGTQKWVVDNFTKDSRIKAIKADVTEDEWNLSAARNIGYKHSQFDILCFLDADTFLQRSYLQRHKRGMADGMFYSGTIGHCSGCCIIHKKDFEKVGGYNELLQGWGSEDLDIYQRLVNSGIKQVKLIPNLLSNMPHGNEIRNLYHSNRDIFATNDENHLKAQKEFKGIW